MTACRNVGHNTRVICDYKIKTKLHLRQHRYSIETSTCCSDTTSVLCAPLYQTLQFPPVYPEPEALNPHLWRSGFSVQKRLVGFESRGGVDGDSGQSQPGEARVGDQMTLGETQHLQSGQVGADDLSEDAGHARGTGGEMGHR